MSKEPCRLFAFLLTLAVIISTILGQAIRYAEASRATRSVLPPVTSVDLSNYARIGRFDLPEPTRTAHPPNSLLAQEASAVTYDWDSDTLFVVGDGGTSVVQVTKTGQLIDSMTLAPGPSPQGTDFFDTEGITYMGAGKFVILEERYRQANLFTYVPGGILHKTDVQTVKLGTTIGNIGLEGISYDPLTSGFICVKEKDPQSIFQTGIDFVAGTATNGSPTATSSADLFNPALANLADFSDVFALSNRPSLNGHPDYSHLLVLSQESGQIINIDRNGNIS
ncbi:MAG TPA: SdiA-regulated domain-containing protein, partial [Pyrinomonadaceae bacterium]|nr:SdiA-regulated domain-containing protein [Pyrinomonadaceae bacterium]